MGLYDKIFKPKKLVLANGKVVEEKCSRAPLIIVLLVIATWISVKVTGFSMTTLVTRIRFFFDILAQMFPPKVGYISSIWGPLFDTIKMSLLGSFVGGVLAIPFAILASSNLIKNKKGIKNGQDIISCPDRRSCAYKSAVCSDFSGIVRRIFSTRFLSIFFTKKVNPSFVVITSPSFGK